MDKYRETVVIRTRCSGKKARMTKALMKTIENLAYERAGKTAPYDDAEIFEEIMAVKAELREITAEMSDDAALLASELFEKWESTTEYSVGDRFLYNGNLYRCKAENPINPTWTPDVAYDYYEPVAKPSEYGTLENPITAVAGMQYEAGKYYAEGGKLYLCTRSEILYYLPSALVGHYFEEVIA